jgi:hypothetical protein
MRASGISERVLLLLLLLLLTTLSLQVSTFGKWATHECCRFAGLKIVDLKKEMPRHEIPRERERETGVGESLFAYLRPENS